MRTGTGSLLALLSLSGGPVPAQAPQPPPSPPLPQACTAAEHREFDFWIGTWSVTTRGLEAGTNLITSEESGCLIHEHWTGARGGTGQSFNFYDRQDGKWHQVWVSSAGAVLRLSGSREGNAMRLTGETTGPGGSRILQRLTFTVDADGTVRQLWESSSDGGRTWSVTFDGLYRRAT